MRQAKHTSHPLVPCSMFHVARRGISLIEILIAIGVFSTIIYAVVGLFAVSQESAQIGRGKTKGAMYAREYIEYIKNIKRIDWDALITGRYVIQQNGNNVELVSTVNGEAVGNYTRYVEIEDVYRTIAGDIIDPPGMVDPSTKKITVTVSWTGFKPGSITQSTYITRYLDNIVWIQTTKTDFDTGTHSGTTTRFTGGDPVNGEVILGAGGGSDWCNPNLTISGVELNGQGVAKSVTAIEGRAFAATGDNASGWTFSNIEITNTSPPVGSVLGYYNSGKGNDVFGDENYGYIATDTNSKEVIIINISSLPYTEAGYFNPPPNSNGKSVFVSGNIGYMIENSTLWNFDLSSKTGQRSALDLNGVSLEGTGTSVVVVGDYAYVTSSLSHDQLQIYNISVPSAITFAASVTLPTSAGARDVFINPTGTRAYIVTDSSSADELFIVDITTKSSPLPILGSYNTNGMSPTAVEVVPGGKAVIVGTGGEEYQVVTIATESMIVQCGGIQVDTGIFDSASVLEADSDAYTYIVTGDASQEFRIIEGGPGGAYAASGIFESQTFDPGFNSTAYNRFDATVATPIQTSIRFQVASVDPGTNGCIDASFGSSNFVGPDGSSGSFFIGTGGAIPTNNDDSGYENPAECFRFRAYLDTTDFTQSPTLHDFSVNYSP